MIKKWVDFSLGLPMTAVSGLCLLGSAYFHWFGMHPVWDPGWVTLWISGMPVLVGALRSLWYERKVIAWLLISIAMVSCLVLGEVFAAAEIAWIIAIGDLLEERTAARAKRGLGALLNRAPQQGRRVLPDGETQWVPAEEIGVGDVLRILPGEIIPVDGVVLTGTSTVDESMLTGESIPVDKMEKASVYGGTINGFGALDIQATKVGADTSLQRLVRLVEEAEAHQAPIQRTVDKWVRYIVPMSVSMAILTVLGNGWWGTPLEESIYRGVTILVVFCPCALALATPTAVVAAIGQAAKYGVVMKSGAALEALGQTDWLVLDKTGTITTGKPAVTDVVSLDNRFTEMDVLAMTASVEAQSEHPLGQAIVREARRRGQLLTAVTDFMVQGGRGVCGRIGQAMVAVGSETYLIELGISIPERVQQEVAIWRNEGKIAVTIAIDGLCIGMIAMADTLRSRIADVVAAVRTAGIRTRMLTGDNAATGHYVAKLVGVERVDAGLLPEEKVREIQRLRDEGSRMVMVGDGVNDAAALRLADVGIAMGDTAGDMAIEAADIVMPGDDVTRLAYIIQLSRETIRTIRRNIALAMGCNLFFALLSMMGWLTPVMGAIVHNVSSVLIVLNAAALYERRIQTGIEGVEIDPLCGNVRCGQCGNQRCAYFRRLRQVS